MFGDATLAVSYWMYVIRHCMQRTLPATAAGSACVQVMELGDGLQLSFDLHKNIKRTSMCTNLYTLLSPY